LARLRRNGPAKRKDRQSFFCESRKPDLTRKFILPGGKNRAGGMRLEMDAGREFHISARYGAMGSQR
jgi:hypothetical protein